MHCIGAALISRRHQLLFRRDTMPVTLDEILTKTGVQSEQIDRRVSQEVLLELAKHCDSLTVVGGALLLSDEQVKEIDQSYNQTEEKRLALVKEWMHTYGADATYRRFVKALVKCERSKQAEEVCEFVSKMGSASHDVINTASLATTPILFGMLINVSGSMQSVLVSDRSATAIAGVECKDKFICVLKLVKNIITRKNAGREQLQDSVFVGTIGLGFGTCDLISLLESQLQSDSEGLQIDSQKALVELAKQNGAEHIEPWISKLHLSKSDSKLLYDALLEDNAKLQKLIKLIPSCAQQEVAAASTVSDLIESLTGKGLSRLAEDAMAHNLEAVKFVKEVIGSKVQAPELSIFTARPVKQVSDLLDKLLQKSTEDSDFRPDSRIH